MDATPRHDRRKRTRIVSGTVSRRKQFLAGVFAAWLVCGSQFKARAQETPQSNWNSADAPCAKYDDLRRPVLGEIGVKIDATGPWADGFRRAFSFWNAVLAANFHEETNLDSCAVRIVNAGTDILNNAMVARSQLTERSSFRGKIAVSPEAAKAMEQRCNVRRRRPRIGHMLGLKHSASSQSIMYFLNVNGTEILDRKDILDLSRCHKLRVATVPTGISIDQVLMAAPIPMPSGFVSSTDWWTVRQPPSPGRNAQNVDVLK